MKFNNGEFQRASSMLLANILQREKYFEEKLCQQDRQCTYKATLRSVRVTTVAVEKQ